MEETELSDVEMETGLDLQAEQVLMDLTQDEISTDRLPLPDDLYRVAFSPICQYYFEKYDIAWGVQWEIARLETSYEHFHCEQISEKIITKLRGTNAINAPKVARLVLSGPRFIDDLKQEKLLKQSTLISPWEEYDEEEESYIRAKDFNQLLNQDGGKIIQRMRGQIQPSQNGGKETPMDDMNFRFTLEQPTKSTSNRFARFLGSRRLVECRFPKKQVQDFHEQIIQFFKKYKLLVNGRQFQAFYAHDSKIQLIEIDQDFGRVPNPKFGDSNRMSLMKFLEWHNDPKLNSDKKKAKWASRLALGFSVSRPGLIFKPEQIHSKDDTCVAGVLFETAAAHEVMTDGCGLINLAALKAIQNQMAWETLPTCVQARIAGAKGLFLMHPEHRDPSEPPQIWIAQSQVKIRLDSDVARWSRFHRVLDVCSKPFLNYPSSITFELIVCLSYNGVPEEVFKALSKTSIQKFAIPVKSLHGPHASKLLWDYIYNCCRILQFRLRQIVPPELQRAHGLSKLGGDINYYDELDLEGPTYSSWDSPPDPASGQPSRRQDQVLGLLQAGFSPTNPLLTQKLADLEKYLMSDLTEKYRIHIPESLRAFIVPDPLGVLEEDEIFFASSCLTDLTGHSGLSPYCLTGSVIVARNPCVQISDVKKVSAVHKDELLSKGYQDVIVFSTKSTNKRRSLASLLGGGDYDGDTVIMIWNKNIVENFTNPHERYARPTANFEKENFNLSNQTLQELMTGPDLGETHPTAYMIDILLGGIVPNQMGTYSRLYRNSAYVNGIDHEETARLGHMYTTCLDSGKSGLVVNGTVLSQDKQKWDKKPPECFPTVKGAKSNEEFGLRVRLPPRDSSLPPFVLESLRLSMDHKTKQLQDEFGIHKDKVMNAQLFDQDPLQPFKEAEKRSKKNGFGLELDKIMKHVDYYRKEYEKVATQSRSTTNRAQSGPKSTKSSTLEWKERMRNISNTYNLTLPSDMAMFSDADVRRVAASYAYKLDTRFHQYKFSLLVAWNEICHIQAQSTGNGYTSLAEGFMDVMAMPRKIADIIRDKADK